MPDTRLLDTSYSADPAKYPSFRELLDLLIMSGIGLSIPDARLQSYQDTAIQAVGQAAGEWEQATGWFPFLSTRDVETRTFDGDGAETLHFHGGLVSLASLSVGGTPYTLGHQFVLGPPNADRKGKPFTYLDFGLRDTFFRNYYADNGSAFFGVSPIGLRAVSVTGQWGYCLNLPADARRAILYRAAEMLYPVLVMAQSGAISQATTADGSTIKFRGTESNPFSTDASSFMAATKNYRRLIL